VYFKEGRCTRGVTCNYAHGDHELQSEPRGPEIRGRPPARAPGPAGRYDVRSGRDSGHRQERSRSARRKGVSFAKSGALPGVERSECVVHGPPPPRKRPTAAQAPAPDEPKAADTNGYPRTATDGAHGDPEEQDEAKKDPGAKTADAVDKPVDVDAEAEKEVKQKVDEGKPSAASAVAAFLLSEVGAAELDETYGLGARLLRGMGWRPGTGVGVSNDGELEPVSIQLLVQSSTHFGRKDRRCLGRRKPRRFRDSDESSPSRTPSSSSSSRSGSKSSAKSSNSSSKSSRKKKRRRRTKRKRSRSSSSSSSKSSSSSSRSKRRKRKERREKFSSQGPAAAAGAAAAAAGAVKAPPEPAAAAAKEDPETAQAKKRVLAKLTELQKVEPKEQRAKEFRTLLRDWHPDKNPEKLEMATAVFQFLQKGKSLLNLK
ncbi:unnamed protein product, partial [Polarella glacialis]